MLTAAEVRAKLNRVELLKRELEQLQGKQTLDEYESSTTPLPTITIGVGWAEGARNPHHTFETPGELLDLIRNALVQKREAQLSDLRSELKSHGIAV